MGAPRSPARHSLDRDDHERAQPARQHGRVVCGDRGARGGGLHARFDGHDGSPGSVRCRAGRSLRGVPRLQLQAGIDLHGGQRQPLSGWQPGCAVAHGRTSSRHRHALCARRSRVPAPDPDLRHDPRDLLAHSLDAFRITGRARPHVTPARCDGILRVGGGADSLGAGRSRRRDGNSGPVFSFF